MENEFPLGENEELLGGEDTSPLVAIMVLPQGYMLLLWVCNMAAFSRMALEFMMINPVSHL